MASPAEVPSIHFAQARGARLAYQDFGSGDEVIVAMPPFAQNIEVMWEWPAVAEMLTRLGSFSRYVHFDKRGTGASDRTGKIEAIDERVDDLRAVMDACGIERAHVLGASEGGPIAMLFAATYPDRVDSLILLGTAATGVPVDWTDEDREAASQRWDVVADLWGTADSPIVDRFAPSLAGDPDFRRWFARFERSSAERDSIRAFLDLNLYLDVREILPDIDVPTLVIHRTGDRAQPVEDGRELGRAIPAARYIEVPGNDHFGYAGDMSSWIDPIEEWVAGTVTPQARPRGYEQVRIRTLGRFVVEVGGREVPNAEWNSRLARQLCKRLVAARGWPVTRDALMDMLWPDESDLGVLGPRLSVQLSKVRRVLGGGVNADREAVRLDLGEVRTDLEDLYEASDDAAIVAAYTGEFLPEDVFEDWTVGPRDDARTRFVTAARRLLHAAAGRGEHARAAGLARRLISLDRYDDDAHRALVLELDRLGEAGEARHAHTAWREAMAEIGLTVPTIDVITP
ncbi:MAG: alpha/beta fold hydrolase [Acidimicrobiia bacterium]|nr:alpha/beta fold hydrolase [Acidimicrobiia bacterium]